MLLIDENKLTVGVISLIGQCYGMEYDYDNFDEDTYDEYIDEIVQKLQQEPF